MKPFEREERQRRRKRKEKEISMERLNEHTKECIECEFPDDTHILTRIKNKI